MSFKSVLGKIGKVALKAAPIAAAFIPGIGPLASMAIGAGTAAASKKLEGGSLKDAVLAGGMGAAQGYGTGSAKGIGPSASVASKAGKVANVMGKVNQGIGMAGPIMGAIASGRSNPSSSGNSSAVPRAPMQEGNAPGFQYGTNNPNLADSILAGRRNAVASQPFRAGYDITKPSIPTDPNSPPKIIANMPRIPSDFGPTRNRRRQLQPVQ